MERIGDIVSRWLAGVEFVSICRACWCRQSLGAGVRCVRCGGITIRAGL